ncbi:hypothetical protein CF326_g9941, partial [Tilletia indica]
MAGTRNTRYSTHFSITTDIVFGLASSKDYLHEVDSTIYDLREGHVDVKTHVWAASAPLIGSYIINHFNLSTTNGLILTTSDANCMRRLPDEEEDATSSSSLASVLAYLSGLGCVKSVTSDKKACVVGGLVYQGKTLGWVVWEAVLRFPEGGRFGSWTMPAPRTMISFEALWDRMNEDDMIEATITRFATMDAAPAALIQALNLVPASTNSKAAHLKQLRASAEARAKAATLTPVQRQEPSSTEPPSEPKA